MRALTNFFLKYSLHAHYIPEWSRWRLVIVNSEIQTSKCKIKCRVICCESGSTVCQTNIEDLESIGIACSV